MNGEYIRAFFAIILPKNTLKQIAPYQKNLKQIITARVKWVPISHLHITIKFIRALSPKHIPDITASLQTYLNNFGVISLTINSLEFFPTSTNPRVIWFGFKQNEALYKAAAIVENVFLDFGYPKERRTFSPHLTIGRIRKNQSGKNKFAFNKAGENFNPLDYNLLPYPAQMSAILF